MIFAACAMTPYFLIVSYIGSHNRRNSCMVLRIVLLGFFRTSDDISLEHYNGCTG